MRDMPIAMRQLLLREDLALCYLVKLTLISGASYYYTDCSQSVYYGGKIWRAEPGVSVSAIRDAANALSQTATIEVGYDDAMITEDMVRKGALSGATHQILVVDYRFPEVGAFEVFGGAIDKLTASNRYTFSVDLTGYQGKSYQLNGVYSLKCRNIFCDQGCKLNIEDYSYPFELAADSLDGVNLTTVEAIADGAGSYGSVLWTEGRNAGAVMPVATNVGNGIALTNSPGFQPLAGEKGILRAGCDYYKATCKDKYNNLVNFQAEPSVPQGDTTSADKTTVTATPDPQKPPATASTVYAAPPPGYIGLP